MPDISLLQDETEVRLKESRFPGVFSTGSLILMLISIGAYVGLFLYKIEIQNNLNIVIESIDKLQIGDISSDVGQLSRMEGHLNVLKKLRTEHTDSQNLLSAVSDSVHQNIYYQNAEFDVKKNTISLKGVAVNPASLAKQVTSYRQHKAVENYEISNVGFVGEGVGFSAFLKIKPAQ